MKTLTHARRSVKPARPFVAPSASDAAWWAAESNRDAADYFVEGEPRDDERGRLEEEVARIDAEAADQRAAEREAAFNAWLEAQAEEAEMMDRYSKGIPLW